MEKLTPLTRWGLVRAGRELMVIAWGGKNDVDFRVRGRFYYVPVSMAFVKSFSENECSTCYDKSWACRWVVKSYSRLAIRAFI